MKALSIRQPWAWLIANGIATVENRSWKTSYRGEFLIHASRQIDLDTATLDELRRAVYADYGVRIPDELPTGGIVGQARIVDCVRECTDENDRTWHDPDSYALLIRDAKPLPFSPTPGRLRFFEAALP